MKDATSELRAKYIELLSSAYPVYDDEVNDTISPYSRLNPPSLYYIISNQNTSDESVKCKFQGRYTIQLDSIATFPAYSGGYYQAELLADRAMQLILPNTSGSFMLPNFHVIRSRIDLSRNLSEKTNVQNIYRRITIFNHSIEEI